jgi:hypothetical protein
MTQIAKYVYGPTLCLLDIANVLNTLLADQNITIDVYLPKYSGSCY